MFQTKQHPHVGMAGGVEAGRADGTAGLSRFGGLLTGWPGHGADGAGWPVRTVTDSCSQSSPQAPGRTRLLETQAETEPWGSCS